MSKELVNPEPAGRPVVEPAERPLSCPECDYDLTGATGARCPWCGWAIDADALLRETNEPASVRKAGVAIAAAVFGSGSLVGIGAMMKRGRHLDVWDSLAVLGVVLAACGHLLVAGMAATCGPRFPLRGRIAGDITFWLGTFAVMAGIAGAAGVLEPAISPRLVRGVTVTYFFEFALAATFFTLPAWALLLLRFVAFRDRAGESATRAQPPPSSSVHGRAEFLIEFFGPLGPGQVAQVWSPSQRPTTASLERAIEEAWATEQALANAAERPLHNESLARLVSYNRCKLGARLVLGTTTYREYVGTHVHNAGLLEQAGRQMFAEAIGVSAIVGTSDGWLALGIRSDRVLWYPGAAHTFGGMLKLADESSPSVFSALLRELEEELKLAAGDVLEILLLGLVRDRALRQPELVFDAVSRRSRDQLLQGALLAADAGEHARIEFLPDDPGRVLPALEALERPTPVAQAAVLLHGRATWGTRWYEGACARLHGGLPEVVCGE